MRKTILLIWLLVPVLVGAYHYGPGQDRMVLDEIDAILSRADADARGSVVLTTASRAWMTRSSLSLANVIATGSSLWIRIVRTGE